MDFIQPKPKFSENSHTPPFMKKFPTTLQNFMTVPIPIFRKQIRPIISPNLRAGRWIFITQCTKNHKIIIKRSTTLNIKIRNKQQFLQRGWSSSRIKNHFRKENILKKIQSSNFNCLFFFFLISITYKQEIKINDQNRCETNDSIFKTNKIHKKF